MHQQAVVDEPAIDILAFETVPCLKELRAITRLLNTEGFGKPAWVSCSCASATTVPHGESLVGAHAGAVLPSRVAPAQEER